MNLTAEDGDITCVGNARDFSVGETVELEGEYVEHPVYGLQFKFTSLKAIAPEDRISVLRYLSSGAVKGVGPKLAEKIVERFGDDTFRILEEEPERLAEVKGISIKKAMEITDRMVEKRDARNAVIFMQEYGIGLNLATKLYDFYGMEIYNVLRTNPYRLSDEVPAVGFKTADAIARKLGIEEDSVYRIHCGVAYELERLAAEGHCYCPRKLLCAYASELLGLAPEDIEPELADMAMDGRITLKEGSDGPRVYLKSYYQAETFAARRLTELRDSFCPPGGNEKDRQELVEKIEKEMSMELESLQKKALLDCMTGGVFILSGGPGTGKTTTIHAIIKWLEKEGREFALAAPTGRAARRMKETTGYEAQTLHRLLEIGRDEDGNDHLYRNEDRDPLDIDTLIVDEVSMVDIHLLRALMNALANGTQLILVGDVDQLPSVGPGQVLKDIMDSGAFACVRLKQVFRQAENSHIVSYAHMINEGRMPDLSVKYPDFFLLEKDSTELIQSYIYQLVSDVLPRKLKVSGADIQLLTPMKKGNLGVEQLNIFMQEKCNPPSDEKMEYSYGSSLFREGDRVMQIKNDYELEWDIYMGSLSVDKGKGVFNGDTGTVDEINAYLKIMKVIFDDGRVVYYEFSRLDELELAYAVTVHKSQGSEYPVVILPLLSGPQMLFHRNILYTAVTRAKQCVIILGSSAAVRRMVETETAAKRYTSLSERIKELEDP